MQLTQGQELFLFLLFFFVFFLVLFALKTLRKSTSYKKLELVRSRTNPVFSPKEENYWESEAVFNPTAFYDGEKVHLFYRAIGGDGVSRVGYATSNDGIHFDTRLPYPIYELRDDTLSHIPSSRNLRTYHPGLYASGGSWGGVEDPRVVKIEDHVHMTFTAFMGWNNVRMAISSISYRDLLDMKWRWRDPGFLSPPSEVHKNWVLFPEKINGKYAVLHSISPRILIHYADSLDELYSEDSHIKSVYEREDREDRWDSWIRGVGPPPLKTKEGWLLFYHAMDKKDPNRYKVGAMLLDLDDPTKVCYRSPVPLLSPDMSYENEGKGGVVYATGAVIIDDRLLVYYGGGDRTVNIACAPLSEFLDELTSHKELSLHHVC